MKKLLPRIVADNKIPYLKGVFEPVADVEYLSPDLITPQAVADADVLVVRTRTHCDAALLSGSRCRFIATATIGFDHIDTEYCRAHGIGWTNAPGCNASSVAQYVLASLYIWAEKNRRTLPSCCIGVVGVGHVGSIVADYCRRIGMTVLLNDPPRAEREGGESFTPLGELAERCDILTFHTPLVSGGDHPTFHLADRHFLSGLRRKPLLINSARGEVVDNAALAVALSDGIVGDAVVDCWEHEPDAMPELLRSALIATPHIAGYSADGKANATRMAVDAVAHYLQVEVDRSGIVPASVENPVIDLQDSRNPVADAVWATYDPRNDSRRLIEAPHTFEQLRGAYGLRREFGAYRLKNIPEESRRVLFDLGFKEISSAD